MHVNDDNAVRVTGAIAVATAAALMQPAVFLGR